MSDFPFWDDVCLRGSIDRAPMPVPPRSLFDRDLFCDENGIDEFDDILPPLPPSPQLPTPLRDLPPLLRGGGIDLIAPSTPPQQCHTLCAPSSHLQAPPLPPTLPHHLATSPSPSTAAASLTTPTMTTPSTTTPTPSRQWRSFLDDNCPLRKRVKVTIIPSARKRELDVPSTPMHVSSPPLKKPRHSQTRVTAPRRLQTTFRVPKPGDASSRLTLRLPSPIKRNTPLHAQEASPIDMPMTPREEEDLLLSLEDLLSRDGNSSPSLDLEDPQSTTESKADEEQLKHAQPVAKKQSSISQALNERISSMTANLCVNRVPTAHGVKSRTYSSLPLVDAAVHAVSRAARAYSDRLASVVSPVAASAVATIGMSRPVSSSVPSRVSKKRKTRRRRTLLSFDDREVKPLVVDDDTSKTPESPLTRYLNCPSPCAKRAKAC